MVIEEIRNKMSEKISDNRNEIEKIKKELQKLAEKKEELNNELIESEKAGNYERFKEVQKKLTELQFLEDFQNRKMAAALKPLTSHEVYNEDVNKIFEELDQITGKARKKIDDLLDKIYKTAEETNKVINDVNQMSGEYVKELLKDDSKDFRAVKKYGKYIDVYSICFEQINKIDRERSARKRM